MIDLRLGDCLEVLKTLPDNSVDSIVTDPPYHLTSITKRFGKEGSAPAQFGTDGAFARASKGFMGKEWDGGDIAFRTDVWSECLRVLKPGGHLLSFGGSRTYHRMAVAIEDAGFEVRDQIMWVYGSGFPKSHNIGKAIDKIQGNEREVVGDNPNHRTTAGLLELGFQDGKESSTITKGTSPYEGWGTALKPAHEPICMARKPLSEKSIAENVLKHRTGGINIDDSRIGNEVRTTPIHSDDVKDDTTMFGLHKTVQHHREETTEGRFPANIIFECTCDEVIKGEKGETRIGRVGKDCDNGIYEGAGWKKDIEGKWFNDKGDTHTNPECPCYMLDEQSGISKSSKLKSPLLDITGGSYNKAKGNTNTITERGHNDKGGASRFFYSAKFSKKEQSEFEDFNIELTPEHEPICMARKPLSEKSVAENVLKHGTGGINIDECRIESDEKLSRPLTVANNQIYGNWNTFGGGDEPTGRFPANIMFDEEAAKLLDEQSGERKVGKGSRSGGFQQGYIDGEVKNRVVNEGYNDKGGASRFFYSAKVSKKERNMGLDGFELKSSAWMSPDSRMDKENYDRTSPGMERFKPQPRANIHPTVKPIALMEYLIKLVTPKGGVVLDPFMGSGSTGIAAKKLGFNFIGIEREEEYMEIAKARINNYEL